MKKKKTEFVSTSESSSQKKEVNNSSSKKKELQSMEDLLFKVQTQLIHLKRGDKVKAKILKIGKNEILCDIGAKSYGIVIGREFDLIRDLVHNFKAGDLVDAEVIIPEMEGGETLISLRKKAIGQLWSNLNKIKNKDEEITVEGVKAVSGGLLTDCFGLRGFIPQTQLDPNFTESPESLVGKEILVKILEVSQNQNRLVLSQKEVSQKEELAAKRQAIALYKTGEEVKAQISEIDKYGLYVEIEKKGERASGFIHISEVSWERVENLASLYNIGASLKARIVGLDSQEGRLNLSLKQLTEDPWQEMEKRYKVEKTVKGTVARTSPLGVFVELEKGIEGLLHVSKIPVGKEFEVGDKIPVTIERIDSRGRKISLSYVLSKKPIGYR